MTCDYCGLPAGAAPRPAEGVAPPVYCCFGCRFAAEVTRGRGEEGAATWALTRLGLAIFLTMNVMVFTMALWTQDLYGADGAGAFVESLRGLFRYLSLLFALPVLLLLGGPLLENAWSGLRRGGPAADLLLLSGVAASYVYSAVSVLREDGPIYFEVGCMVLVFVTLGRWLEATGKLKTTAALEALQKLLPERARRVDDGAEREVPLDELTVGDRLRILAGERVPCDGRILRNSAAIDEQVLTGESQPALKGPGDRVFGGTLNLDGDLVIETTAPPRGGALTRLIELVREARLTKGRHERLADQVARWFLPAVTLIALVAFAGHTWAGGLERGLLTGLAVLLIACPCALGLATPMAVWAALGRAAQAQVLFRNGDALERLAQVRAVRLDKTGTLTTGTPTVAEVAMADDTDADEALAVARALAEASAHAHCRALRAFLACDLLPLPSGERGNRALSCDWSRERETGERHVTVSRSRHLTHDRDFPLTQGPSPTRGEGRVGSTPALSDCENVRDVRTTAGRGLSARRGSSNDNVYLGSPAWMAASDQAAGALAAAIERATAAGQALTCLGWGGVVRAVFILREELRPEAAAAVGELRALGLDVAVLTGDHAARGRAIGQELGLAVEAGQMPEDKVAAVQRARREVGAVAMVGDGINDAPALAASDVGVALGCGADVSRDAAAVCLLGNDLLRLPWAVRLARQTVRVVRRNLFWAFAYNVLGVAIACTGRLNPVLASLAMVLSSLFVVTNSLRLASGEERAS